MFRQQLIAFCLVLMCAACESAPNPSSPSLSSSPTAAADNLRIPIGQSAQVTVGLNEPLKSVVDPAFISAGFDDYRFRVVHVTASEPLTAILRVVSDTETDARPAAWRVLNTACCAAWSWQSIHQVTLTLLQPTVLEIELAIPVAGPAATFTVSTSRVEP